MIMGNSTLAALMLTLTRWGGVREPVITSISLGMGQGYGDPEYLMAFFNIVLPVAFEFDPQLVIVSAGFDAGLGDPVSGYKV